MSLRDQILAADDRPFVKEDVPEWKCIVYVHTMTGRDRDAFEIGLVTQPAKRGQKGQMVRDNMRARLLVKCLRDENSELIFNGDPADIVALGDKSGNVLGRLFEVARKLNGLSDEDVEELEKNLEGAPSEDSGTS
jgi:hypothetical protein